MSVFDSLIGQDAVINILQRAALAARGDASVPESAMSQTWLITGPPGSGRSVAARAFAAALECTGEEVGCGKCAGCQTVMAGSHPDVEIFHTKGVNISVAETRELVSSSYVFPTTGRRRVIAIEDADRMLERTSNVLLKAIEEPPASTVWILITASAEDMLPTIRSRCRTVSLKVPDSNDVAALLMREFPEITAEEALNVAHASQSHIGRARGLLKDQISREERQMLLSSALKMVSVGDAVYAAKDVVERYPVRDKERKKQGLNTAAALEESQAGELEKFRISIGLAPGQRETGAQRTQVRAFVEQQKRRATRQHRDYIDRALIDLLSLYRDVLSLQVDAHVELVNSDFRAGITELASHITPEETISRMDAISHTRQRLGNNMPPQLALEALFVNLRVPAR